MIKSNCTGKSRTTDLNCLFLQYYFWYWPINSFIECLRCRFHSFFFYSFGKTYDSICEVATGSALSFSFWSHNSVKEKTLCMFPGCLYLMSRLCHSHWLDLMKTLESQRHSFYFKRIPFYLEYKTKKSCLFSSSCFTFHATLSVLMLVLIFYIVFHGEAEGRVQNTMYSKHDKITK